MVIEYDRPGISKIGDLPGQVEARPYVGHDGDVRPERGPDMPRATRSVGQGADGVGVDVIDVGGGQEGVKERFNRRPPRARLDHAGCQVGDHLLVGHCGPLTQRQELIQIESRKAIRANRGQVGAAPFDAQD